MSGLSVLYCFAIMTGAALHTPEAEFRVPLMSRLPELDGKFDLEEWSPVAGFDGFAWEGQLERRRVRAFVGATDGHLCFAFLSQLPVEGHLLTQVERDNLKIVYDDSIEVWIDPTPGMEHGRTFQMLANPSGRQGYKMHPRGNVQEEPDWRGNWEIANGFHDGYWHCEVLVPLADIASDRSIEEGAWGINLCRNWKRPWAFSSLGGRTYAPENTRFVFVRDAAPAVSHEHRADPFTGDIHSALVLNNPSQKPLSVQTEMVLTRDLMPEASQTETLSLEPGEGREVALRLKDEASRRFDLTLRVTSPDGEVSYYRRSCGWRAGPPWQWKVTGQDKPPVDIQFAYYPYLNRMRIFADVTGLPKDAVLDRLIATIRHRDSKDTVKAVDFHQFVNGRQEQTLDLPPLDGEYEIAVTVAGENVPTGELLKSFQRTPYEWEHNELGRSTRVYPPFTPLRVDGKRVFAVLREHEMNDLGLWDQVIAKGKPILARPMRFRVVCEGQEAQVKPGSLRFTQTDEHKVLAESGFRAGQLSARVRSMWDYDGMMLMELTLLPADGQPVDSLVLEVPLRNDAAPLIHAMGDGIRNTIYKESRKDRAQSGQARRSRPVIYRKTFAVTSMQAVRCVVCAGLPRTTWDGAGIGVSLTWN